MDKQAFVDNVIEAEDTLYRISKSILLNNQDCEDVVQGAILKAYDKLEDYKMTEQDKKDEAEGKYRFGFGSEEVEIVSYKFLDWEQDGVYYSFLVEDSNISQDELVEMAHQIIDAQ